VKQAAVGGTQSKEIRFSIYKGRRRGQKFRWPTSSLRSSSCSPVRRPACAWEKKGPKLASTRRAFDLNLPDRGWL